MSSTICESKEATIKAYNKTFYHLLYNYYQAICDITQAVVLAFMIFNKYK